MKKTAILIIALATLSLYFASVSIAGINPVPQTLGYADVEFNALTEAECRVCHDGPTTNGAGDILNAETLPNRHHLLYGTDMTSGVCSGTVGTCDDGVTPCAATQDCPEVPSPGTCATDGTACNVDADCPDTYVSCDLIYGGYYCNDGSFAACTVDTDCPVASVQTCDGAVTVCEANGDPCATDGDCPVETVNTYVECTLIYGGMYCNDGSFASCTVDEDCPIASSVDVPTACSVPLVAGTCDNVEVACYSDAECDDGVNNFCGNGRGICDPAASTSSECGSSRTTCSPGYCKGNAAITANPTDGIYSCLTCHEEITDPVTGLRDFYVERDCMVCHINTPASPSVHHLNVYDPADPAKRECTNCHGYVVNSADAVIPTYGTSLVTPAQHVVDGADNQLEGGCAYCHNVGTDVATGIEVIDNHDTHHDTGVYKDRFGDSIYAPYDFNKDGVVDPDGERLCAWCHINNDYHAADLQLAMRTCEECHDKESLHSIQADSDGDGQIIVGSELYGFGHVGIDDPTGDSDCMGCHSMVNRASAAGSDTITPDISAVTPIVINAGTPTDITVTGMAFTNDDKTSVLELTPVLGGAAAVITPATISVDEITASINAPAGLYKLRAVKDDVQSNAIVIAVIPESLISITEIHTNCGGDCDGTATIEGSGFGDVIPGDEDFLSVLEGEVELTITSWTDTKIEVSGVMCTGDPITVNSLMGSATN